MIQIHSEDGRHHTIRGVTKKFGVVLSAWVRLCPEDKFFCQAHGMYEPIAGLLPVTAKDIPDRVEEQQAICHDLEMADREKFAKDLERARRK